MVVYILCSWIYVDSVIVILMEMAFCQLWDTDFIGPSTFTIWFPRNPLWSLNKPSLPIVQLLGCRENMPVAQLSVPGDYILAVVLTEV